MVDTVYYAHTLPDKGPESWQYLKDHLCNVAKMAAQFAASFHGENFAKAAGFAHDFGKFSSEFQARLMDAELDMNSRDKDHSSAGAQILYEKFLMAGHLCAYAVAGHHSGLLDHCSKTGNGCMEARLKKKLPPWKTAEAEQILAGIDLNFERDIPRTLFASSSREFSLSLFCRMIYSCLVDADFLDTEAFVLPEQAAQRPKWDSDILIRMNKLLDEHLDGFKEENRKKRFNEREMRVRELRNGILEDCRNAAEHEPGLFTLTVPTGGGKTLSSLSFALRHAVKYRKKRIVYVIPFISIIEQTAGQFHDIFKTLEPNPVLEVHSNIPLENESGGEVDELADERRMKRLAGENFDAPLVVTTAVQFYESLMGNRSSQCRKLHNLTDAVIILDEVQKIPVEYIHVILTLFKELSTTYRDTVVMCTATQPALVENRYFPIGFKEPPYEMIRDPQKLYEALKRVRIVNLGKQSDEELLLRFEAEEQMLCIVNTRGHASKLFLGLKRREGDYHLSTMMCAVHRAEVLKAIRERVAAGLPCRVISTQLVEAGVDIDFPVVFRSSAGLDSIAQAAGRCNRNGALEIGNVYVFESEHRRSERFQQSAANIGAEVLDVYREDPLGLNAVERFFGLYYNRENAKWDSRDLLKKQFWDFPPAIDGKRIELQFMFASAAEKFKLIEQDTVAVIVEYDDKSIALCAELRENPIMNYGILHRLQRYTVQLHRQVFLRHAGREIELLHGDIPVLISAWTNYSKEVGLTFDDCASDLLEA